MAVKGPVDEALLAGGKKLSEFDEKALAEMLELFEEYKSCSALSIAKQIDTLNKISNEKTEMICDGENIYVFSERVAWVRNTDEALSNAEPDDRADYFDSPSWNVGFYTQYIDILKQEFTNTELLTQKWITYCLFVDKGN